MTSCRSRVHRRERLNQTPSRMFRLSALSSREWLILHSRAPLTPTSLGRGVQRPRAERELHRRGIAKNIQHRTMAIDDILQARKVLLRSRTIQDHLGFDRLITRPHALPDIEEALQVDRAGELNRNTV